MWNLLDQSIELTGGGLVKLDLLFQTSRANGIEHAKNTNSVGIGRVFGHVKGHLDVTHGTQVVDFGRLGVGNDGDQVGGIAQVTVMQIQLHSSLVSVTINMVDAAGVETRRTTDDSMDLESD